MTNAQAELFAELIAKIEKINPTIAQSFREHAERKLTAKGTRSMIGYMIAFLRTES